MTPASSLRHYFENLARSGHLNRAGLQVALTEAHILPNTQRWARFIDLCLLVAGSFLVLAGVLFFFAYNWDDLHRFAKITLVLVPLSASAILAQRSGLDNLRGKALIAAATMLTGILLAVLGQIYQTGADSEWLFIAWTILIFPWVLIAKLPWLWAFWLSLLNIALALALTQRLDGRSENEHLLVYPPFLFNLLALFVWELLTTRWVWMRNTLVPRFIMLLLCVIATIIGFEWWWVRKLPYALPIYLVWLAGSLYFYRWQRHDIFPLALLGFSGVLFATSGMLYALSLGGSYGAEAYLLISFILIALTGGLALWLRQTNAAWRVKQSVGDIDA